ncbi:choice-of-anchor M domain-containing protein [Trueperella pyogenes]|uniref:choice-of-anchor M domain-containing protein n=1 Tax=Trueperella pyogenes TaxID=1661 RepID=UPI002285004B|nr:choice-of-anchor M domain-containing protein [Trueperella pyogenes]
MVAIAAPAHAETDRTEFTGGHIDAFYVYNLPEETSHKEDGKYETKIHLDVKEDVTGSRIIRDPNTVRLVSKPDAFMCFTGEVKDIFGTVLPGVPGGYVNDQTNPTATSSLNPGYTTHVTFKDSEGDTVSADDTAIVFSDVDFPEGGALAPYGIWQDFVNGTGTRATPELVNEQYAIQNGSKWDLTSSHHHAKWVASKAGTYRFKVTAVVTKDDQEFRSETKQYEWVFQKSDLEGTCGSGSKPVEPGDSPTTTPPDEDEDDWGDDEDEPSDNETGSTPDKFKPAPAPTPDKTKPAPAKPDPAPKQQEDHVVLDQGHTDIFNVSAKDGKLELNLKEDITGYNRIRTPEKVTLKVVEAARETISPNVYDGIMTSGYFLPFNEKKGILWPGWETFHVRPEFSHIDLNFVEVSGPGRVQILTQGSFGKPAPILKDGSIDLKTGSVIPVPEPTHVHTNWLFEKPGVYTMKVKASGKNKAGELVTSNTATYTWHVGDFKPGKKDDGSADNTTPGNTDKDKAGPDTGKDKAGSDTGKTAPINIADSTKVRITAPKEIAVEKVDADHPLGYEQLAAAGFKVEALKAQAEKEKHASSDKGSAVSATQLKFGVDYTVSFGDPNRAGDNKIIVAGLGNYTGSVELPIKVVLKSASEQGAPSTGGQSTGTPDTTVPAAGTPNAVAPTAGTPATTRLSHTGASTVLLTSLAALLLAGGAIFAVYRKKA